MYLYNIFLSWNAPIISESFQNLFLKREDVTFARKKEVASYRLFEKDANRIKAYQHFLLTCERALQGINEKPLLDFIVNDLMTAPGLSLNDVDACEKLTQIFCLHFQNQDNVLELAPMGQAFMGEPNAFAAFLRYLIMQGLTADVILSTQLLQDFFLYYCSTISQPGNPVETLYNILNQFPEMQSLTALAKTMCCDEASLASYALDGSAEHPQNTLTKATHKLRTISFTPDNDNLNALHAIFGINFLMAVLHQWESLKKNAIAIESISQLFNQSYTVAIQLPDLLSRLYEQPILQKVVAKILSPETLQMLISNRVGSVLYLIEYCPQLKDAIRTQELPLFIQRLREQTSDEVAFIANVFGLYEGVKHNLDAGRFVLNVLLDAFIASAYAIDDVRLAGKLRKCLNVHDCIVQKVRALESELDAIIQLNTQGSIDEMDYITIEDVWRITALNIKHLRLIESSIKSICPENKYKLYNRLAIAFFNQKDIAFDLDAFTNALGVTTNFAADDVTLYERLLIELLVAIDDVQFRAMCIERLDAYTKHPWKTHYYNNLSLIHHAVRAGNLGLIAWIEEANIAFSDSYDSLARDAANLDQWLVVAYFNTHKQLSRYAVKSLLSLAVTQDMLHIIPDLLNHEGCDIEATLMEAVHKNKQRSVRCIITSSQTISSDTLALVFTQAMSYEDWELAKLVSERGPDNVLQGVIDKEFNDAVSLNKCDVLRSFATYTINMPTQDLVKDALLHAREDKKIEVVKSLSLFVCIKETIVFRPISSNEGSNKQSRLSYFQKSSPFEVSTHAMVTRASSCSALTALQHSFFKSGDDRQLTQSARILTPEPSRVG